jgi:hypothetical protein
MPYLLDANVFIQAKRLHYGFDFCPGFWDWLIDANSRDIVFSIERVQDELLAGSEELAEWAEMMGEDFFLPPDEEVIQAFGQVSDWVTKQNCERAAIDTFRNYICNFQSLTLN